MIAPMAAQVCAKTLEIANNPHLQRLDGSFDIPLSVIFCGACSKTQAPILSRYSCLALLRMTAEISQSKLRH